MHQNLATTRERLCDYYEYRALEFVIMTCMTRRVAPANALRLTVAIVEIDRLTEVYR